MSIKNRIYRDFEFALCSQKAKKVSTTYSNPQLADSLKLVPLNSSSVIESDTAYRENPKIAQNNNNNSLNNRNTNPSSKNSTLQRQNTNSINQMNKNSRNFDDLDYSYLDSSLRLNNNNNNNPNKKKTTVLDLRKHVK